MSALGVGYSSVSDTAMSYGQTTAVYMWATPADFTTGPRIAVSPCTATSSRYGQDCKGPQ